MSDDEGIGDRIRRFRRAKGLSLDEAAGLAGITKPYLSRLERGLRSVDSRQLLTRIAQALEVSVADLTGQPYTPRDREHQEARRGVAAVRLALLDPGDPTPPGTQRELLDRVLTLHRAKREGDLVTQATLAPDLLCQTQQLAAVHRSPDAYRLLVMTADVASSMLRNLGELDLATMAADRMRWAAEETDDPAWVGFAACTQAYAFAAVGALRRASAVTLTAAADITADDPDSTAARGACLLAAGYANVCQGAHDEARAMIAEAEPLAEQLDEGEPGRIAEFTLFSDWNVDLHRVTVEVEAHNAAGALEAARDVTGRELPSRARTSYLWADVGRAWVQLERHRDAIAAFRRAERAAPLRTRLSPQVRDSVRELLDTAHRRAAGGELRGLAERCGVLGN